jgi:crotonobetainyl-CoA:carnitine CoA-transferase CaiB-like acyl-CoA transferase
MTQALAGPLATLILAGLGANVIKIENPGAGDSCRSSAPYLGRNGATLVRHFDDDVSLSALNRLRNKSAVTLNLKKPSGREIFTKMLQKADVVIDNFSSGTMDRLGIGYDFCKSVNPRIICCSISGFGNEPGAGPGKAMDSIAQALSGLMYTSGNEGDPPVRVGVPFGDMIPPLFAVIGILTALHQRNATGRGQEVDISMLGVLTNFVSAEPLELLEKCGVPQRTGMGVPRLAPFGLFPASDGYVAICAPTEAFARSLFVAIGKPEMITDPRFATRDLRVKNVTELDAILNEFIGKKTSQEIVDLLDAQGVPCAEVRTPAKAVRDPRVLARKEVVVIEHPVYGVTETVYGMGLPIRFSEAKTGFDRPSPGLGEHNHKLYGEWLGYSEDEIKEFEASGTI